MNTKKEVEDCASKLESMLIHPNYYDELEGWDIDIKELINYLRNSVPYNLITPVIEMGEDQWDGYPLDAVADQLQDWKNK